MKRLLALLAAVLAVAVSLPAWSAPTKLGGPTGVLMRDYMIQLDDTTDDSPAFETVGACTFKLTKVGTGSVSVYAVATKSTATSSGTLIATLTTDGQRVSANPPTRWARAVASGTGLDGSVLHVECPALSAGGGNVNLPVDNDGDGVTETITIDGSYASPANSPYVIHKAIADLLAAAGASVSKTVIVEPGVYSMAGVTFDWGDPADNDFISMASNTTLYCKPGAIIEGWGTQAEYATWGAASNLIGDPSATTEENVKVIGCKFSHPVFAVPFNSASPSINLNQMCMHFEDTTGLVVVGNEVEGCRHTGIYGDNQRDWFIAGNRISKFGAGMDHRGSTSTLASDAAAGDFSVTLASGACTAWTCAVGDPIVIALDDGTFHHADVRAVSTDTLTIRPYLPSAASTAAVVFRPDRTTTQFPAIYIYASEIDSTDGEIVGNSIDWGGNAAAIQVRAATTGRFIRNVRIEGNTITRLTGPSISPAGLIGGSIVGNVSDMTGGFRLVDDATGAVDYCYSSTPDPDCTHDLTIEGNTWTNSRYKAPGSAVGAIEWGRGHSLIRFRRNTIDRTLGGDCFNLKGNSPGSVIEDVSLANCAANGFSDGKNAGPGVSSPLAVTRLSIKNVGSMDIDARSYRAVALLDPHTALTFPQLSVTGCDGDCVYANLASMSGLTFDGFSIDGSGTGFLGQFTEVEAASQLTLGYLGEMDEATAAGQTCNAAATGNHLITTNASNNTDCTFGSGTGSSRVSCICNGTAFVDYATYGSGYACGPDLEQTWFAAADSNNASDLELDGDSAAATNNFHECDGGVWVDAGGPGPGTRTGINMIAATSQAIDDVTIANGTLKNFPNGSSAVVLQGAESNRVVIRDVHIANDGLSIRVGTDVIATGVNVNATTTTSVTVDGVTCGTGVTTCIGNALAPNELAAGSDIVYEPSAAPSGAGCAAGAQVRRTGGGAGTTLYVCEGGTWAAF